MADDLTIVHDSADELETTAIAVRGGGAIQRTADVVNPMELIRFAIESKTPAAELSQLVALANQVEERNAVKAFHAALKGFQRECPPIKKNKSKSFSTKDGGNLSWSYAEMDAIEAHIKPYLERYDLSYVFDQEVSEKGALTTAICTLSHILGHSRQSRFTAPTQSNSAASPQQKVGAADSYGQRRSLGAVLGLNITDKQVPDKEINPGPTIDEDQATVIADLIAEKSRGRKNPNAVRDGFCKSNGIELISELPASRYESALRTLQNIETKAAT